MMRTWSLADKRRVLEVLRNVQFNEWTIRSWKDGEVIYLQISAPEKCNATGEPLEWTSRKWFLSPAMTDGEIVQTAFKAVMTAVEHEAREQFKYLGVTVFDPHYDIEKLVELRKRADALKERAALK